MSGVEVARDWPTLRKLGFVMVGGQNHSLTHLQDRILPVVVPATTKDAEVRFQMLIMYSSHCISIGPKKGTTGWDFDVLGKDRRILDERGVTRQFSEQRYALSQRLPELLSTFPDRRCFFTGHENFLTIEAEALGLALDNPYEIYFSLTKESKNFLKLVVESAYVRDAEYLDHAPTNFKKADKISARLLMLKKLRNEPIRRPPSR